MTVRRRNLKLGMTRLGFGPRPRSTGAAVSAFALQAETVSAAAMFTTPPTTTRKRTMDRLMRRLKDCGAWPNIVWYNPQGLNIDASVTDWKGLRKGTVVGSPTHTANVSLVGVATTGYINTLLNASTLSTVGLCAFLFSAGTTTSSNVSMGCTNASSQGITIATRRATDNNVSVRLASASAIVTPIGDGDGYGMNGGTRLDDTNVQGFRNGVLKDTISAPLVALPNLNIYYLTNNGNGSPSTTAGVPLAGMMVANNLTLAMKREIYAAHYEYLDAIANGEPYIEEPGIGTPVVTAQFIAHGLNVAAICAVYSAVRAGLTGAICGDHREWYNLGGVSTGGLGFVDYNDLAALGGLPRWLLRQCNLLESVADSSFKFQPKRLQSALRMILDPAKNGGYSIPIYLSRGVSAVTKVGARVTSFTTRDGRVFNPTICVDASYSQSLAKKAGLTMVRGREAAGAGIESNNGVQLSATNLNFQPFVVANTPASGLIPYVQGIRSTFTPALDTVGADGTADSRLQAMNYRMTLTKTVTRRAPFSTTPPPGYLESNYEFLLRFLAGNATVDTFEELVKADLLYSNTYDVNNFGFVSTDYVGGLQNWPEADYDTRDQLQLELWRYILGFLYTCQYSADARVPAGLKTDMANWGFCTDHHLTPYPGDEIFHPAQPYIRECWRLVTDSAQLNGADLGAVDGGVPRISDHIIAMISYNTDSHACERVAFEFSAGNWQTRNEGGIGVATGGVNGNTPVPMEIIFPKVAECTNMMVICGPATTHAGFGAYRMEPTMWMVGQSSGLIAAQRIAADGIVQNTDYPSLRTALLASATLSGEVAPVLTQTN